MGKPKHHMPQSQKLALVISMINYTDKGSQYKHDKTITEKNKAYLATIEKFEAMGFKVTAIQDLNYEQFGTAWTKFSKQVRKCDEVIIWYSGHGSITKDEVPRISPIDAHAGVMNTYSLSGLLRDIAHAKLKCIFLGACQTYQRDGFSRLDYSDNLKVLQSNPDKYEL